MFKNKYLTGFYISIKDNREYKIYSNEVEKDSIIKCLKENDFYVERIICKWQINNKNEHINKPIRFIYDYWNNLTLIQKVSIVTISIAV